MTDEKFNELACKVKIMSDQITDLQDEKEVCMVICSIIDIWCKEHGECSYLLSRLIDSTERERIKKNGM